jgi:hypothetical protein
MVLWRDGEKIGYEFQKNDSLDVEIKWEKHQEVQLSIVMEHKGHPIKL